MKQNTKRFLAMMICLVFSGINFAQNIDNKYSKAALQIMNKASTCSLITLDMEGNPEARMMQTLPTKDDFVIWLATKPNTRKIKQIEHNSIVGVYYEDGSNGYVYLKAFAELVNDISLKRKYWKDSWKSFYPDIESDMILIRVIPKTIQIVSYEHGIISEELNWSAPIIKLEKQQP